VPITPYLKLQPIAAFSRQGTQQQESSSRIGHHQVRGKDIPARSFVLFAMDVTINIQKLLNLSRKKWRMAIAAIGVLQVAFLSSPFAQFC